MRSRSIGLSLAVGGLVESGSSPPAVPVPDGDAGGVPAASWARTRNESGGTGPPAWATHRSPEVAQPDAHSSTKTIAAGNPRRRLHDRNAPEPPRSAARRRGSFDRRIQPIPSRPTTLVRRPFVRRLAASERGPAPD